MNEPPSKRLKITPQKIKKESIQANSTSQSLEFFHGIQAVILENGLGKTRVGILSEKFCKHGGQLQKKLNKDTTHIVVSQTVRYERVSKLLGLEKLPDDLTVVGADWISKCLAEYKKVDIKDFLLKCPKAVVVEDSAKKEDLRDILKPANNEENESIAKAEQLGKEPDTNELIPSRNLKVDDSDSDFVDSGDEKEKDSNEGAPVESKCSPEKTKGTWICAAPSTSKGINHNRHITDKLQVLATSYANTKDQWRALGYKKAIASIQSYHKRIETREECSKLAFVGEKLAKKIWEIVDTGHLRRLDHIDPKIDAINLFTDVWGAGPTTAEMWVSKGFRTLEDLQKHAKLNSQQKIGLKHFEEFRERMPREEAGRIGKQVMLAANEIDPGLVCETCGSYRRGKPTCGDVDVLVSHPDGKSHHGALQKILEKLKSEGFITDDLVSIQADSTKYMGVCKLPGDDSKHRRLDIISVPYCEWACAIMYFTGSDYFNRSMRLLAKKNGMSLTERSLNTGVVRHGGEKVFEGTPLPVCSEKDVFKYLGLDYRTPVERDW